MIAVLFTAEDISARKQMEETLKESERRYHLLIAALPDTAILLFDAQHRYLIAGGEELARTGFEIAKVEGSTLAEAFPPDLVELFAPLYDKALAGEATVFEHNYQGFVYHQKIVPVRNEKGAIYAGMLIAHNITERVHIEDALRKNLEKYQVLFDCLPLGVTVADTTGQIIESNRQAETILGLNREAQKDRTIDGAEWKIIRPDGAPMLSDEFASVRALNENRVVEKVEMGLVKGEGQVSWISVTAAPLKDGGVVITYREIEGPGGIQSR